MIVFILFYFLLLIYRHISLLYFFSLYLGHLRADMVRNQLEPKGADDLHVVQRVVRAGCVDNGGSKQGSSYKELQKSAGSA